MTFETSQPYVLYYTPVSKKLYRDAEKLGELMHCMKEYRDDKDPFWGKTRDTLTSIYRSAWISCQGALLTPPLMNSKTGGMHPIKIDNVADDLAEWIRRSVEEKIKLSMRVEYLAAPPREWVSDL